MMMSAALAMFLMQATTAAPAAQSAPPAVTRAQAEEGLKRGFGAMDTNKDGSVDTAEATKARDAAVAARQKQLADRMNATFAKLDTDKNGSLSQAEFAASVRLPAAPTNVPWLEANDSNKDGRVSLAEASARAKADFDRIDANRDGQLSIEERRAARTGDDEDQ